MGFLTPRGKKDSKRNSKKHIKQKQSSICILLECICMYWYVYVLLFFWQSKCYNFFTSHVGSPPFGVNNRDVSNSMLLFSMQLKMSHLWYPNKFTCIRNCRVFTFLLAHICCLVKHLLLSFFWMCASNTIFFLCQPWESLNQNNELKYVYSR